MEKSIDQMNAAELRAALDEYARAQNPVPAAPLPPGMTADMTQKAQDTASELYGQTIMNKPAGALTPEERAFLRGNIGACLRDMGY
jgi:hypothetical protein